MTSNKDNPKVSIILCVFGYEKYIKETISSILNQTYTDFEFLIIDDGCNYDLKQIVNSFNDKRILYYKNDINIGLTKSLLKALSIARGKYIARMDAGNISFLNRIEIQYNFLENHKEIFLIGTSVMLIDENREEICRIMSNSDFDYVKKALPYFNCINHSTIMFRNLKNISYREKFKYSQDYDFYLRLLTDNKKIGNIKEVLLKERMIKNSITYTKKEEQAFYENKAREFYKERLKTGKDSYNIFNNNENLTENVNKNYENYTFFNRQKAYYLLRSKKLAKTRAFIRESFKQSKELDNKLFIYYIISFFPFLINILNKIKRIELA